MAISEYNILFYSLEVIFTLEKFCRKDVLNSTSGCTSLGCTGSAIINWTISLDAYASTNKVAVASFLRQQLCNVNMDISELKSLLYSPKAIFTLEKCCRKDVLNSSSCCTSLGCTGSAIINCTISLDAYASTINFAVASFLRQQLCNVNMAISELKNLFYSSKVIFTMEKFVAKMFETVAVTILDLDYFY
jgi:hypothetical protein